MLSAPSAFGGGEADDEKIGTAAEQSAAETEPLATVEVPAVDSDELSSFFITSASASQHLDDQEKEEASIDTFNDIFIDSNDMFVAYLLLYFCSELHYYDVTYYQLPRLVECGKASVLCLSVSLSVRLSVCPALCMLEVTHSLGDSTYLLLLNMWNIFKPTHRKAAPAGKLWRQVQRPTQSC